MRKVWKLLPLAAIATVTMQFSFVGVPQAQTADTTTGILSGGMVSGTTGEATTGATTGGTTGGAPTPIAVQPRLTG